MGLKEAGERAPKRTVLIVFLLIIVVGVIRRALADLGELQLEVDPDLPKSLLVVLAQVLRPGRRLIDLQGRVQGETSEHRPSGRGARTITREKE